MPHAAGGHTSIELALWVTPQPDFCNTGLIPPQSVAKSRSPFREGGSKAILAHPTTRVPMTEVESHGRYASDFLELLATR